MEEGHDRSATLNPISPDRHVPRKLESLFATRERRRR